MVHKNKRIIKHTKNERKKLSPNHMVKIYFTSYLRLKFRLRGPPLKRRRGLKSRVCWCISAGQSITNRSSSRDRQQPIECVSLKTIFHSFTALHTFLVQEDSTDKMTDVPRFCWFFRSRDLFSWNTLFQI
jgi:hypothetical protein